MRGRAVPKRKFLEIFCPPGAGRLDLLFANKSMSFNAIAMDACRLMVAIIPKPRVVRSLWRVNMIHALSHPRATIVHVQRAKLILRLRQKPFAVFVPARVIATLPGRPTPRVASFLAAPLFINFDVNMRIAIPMPMPNEIRAARRPAQPPRPQHRITPLTYYHDTLPRGRTNYTI